MYRCLDSILEDNFARSIFHGRHTAKSDRLKNGFVSYKKTPHLYTKEKYEEDKAAVLLTHPESSYRADGLYAAYAEDNDTGNLYA